MGLCNMKNIIVSGLSLVLMLGCWSDADKASDKPPVLQIAAQPSGDVGFNPLIVIVNPQSVTFNRVKPSDCNF